MKSLFSTIMRHVNANKTDKCMGTWRHHTKSVIDSYVRPQEITVYRMWRHIVMQL